MHDTILAASENYGPGTASATDLSDSEDDDSDVSESSSVATSRDALPHYTASLLCSHQSGLEIEL